MSRANAKVTARAIDALERLSIGGFLTDAEGSKVVKRIRQYACEHELTIEKAGWRSYRIWYHTKKGKPGAVKAGLAS